jgi:hypothetical protein
MSGKSRRRADARIAGDMWNVDDAQRQCYCSSCRSRVWTCDTDRCPEDYVGKTSNDSDV